MLLALDIGNTQTVIGLFASGRLDVLASSSVGRAGANRMPSRYVSSSRKPGELVDLLHHWRVATVPERTADEWALLVTDLLRLVGLGIKGVSRDEGVDGVVVSSSVPDATSAIRQMAHDWFELPLVVIGPGVRTGMPILYENPKDVGADRIANAVAAVDLYGAPAIVVDMGTATTFDAISAAGEYVGGAITPGIGISLDALVEHAAALRRVELVEPHEVIGRTTVESIQSGVIYGYTGLVDAMCSRFAAELGPSTVIATGGLARLITPLSEMIEYHEPWLTLHGLRIVFERNMVRDDAERDT